MDKNKSAAASRAQTLSVYFWQQASKANAPTKQKCSGGVLCHQVTHSHDACTPCRLSHRVQNGKINNTRATRPLRVCFVRLAIYTHNPLFWAYDTTLSFLDFLYINFSDFLFFIFSSSTTPPNLLICPFICPTIAQIPFYVQLVVRSDFSRLQRKYGCLCVV